MEGSMFLKRIELQGFKSFADKTIINFDSEAFPSWWGLPSDTDNGGEFQIEYFRYWSEDKPEKEHSIFMNDMK